MERWHASRTGSFRSECLGSAWLAAGAPPSKRDKPFALARGPHLALYVPDISAAEELLISHGVDYAKYDHGAKADKNAFSAQMNALPQIWFYDPDGNGVELAQLPAAADLFPPDQLEPQ